MKGLKIKNNKAKRTKKTGMPPTKKGKKSHIPFRLNFLFFVIFGLFVALIGQLAYLQIMDGDNIADKIKESSVITITESTARGGIYDATGAALVTNKASQAITYTRGNNVTSDKILKIANKVNKLIDVPAEDLTTRDKKDFWLADSANLKKATARLTEKQKGLSTSKEYAAVVDAVKDSEIQFDDETLKAATVFKKMNSAQELNTVYIKNTDVTDDEIAVIGENASKLSGVSTGTDWTREYNDSGSLKSMLGTVSTEKQGLPAEDATAYLKKGYLSNDRVGTSYLEKQYESTLQGKKTKYEVKFDSNGKITEKKQISEGSKGDNLKLTINATFQNKITEILRSNYQTLITAGGATDSTGIYAVVLNPNDGSVLAMSGFSKAEGDATFSENSMGTFTNAFVPGSVVKGGTITAGFEGGVLTGNDTLYDEAIKLAGTAIKGSWFNQTTTGNRIALTAEQALEASSNSYMMKIAFKLLGVDYSYNMSMPDNTVTKTTFDKLRNGFAEYGMGVSTGIDLPGEVTGVKNEDFSDDGYAPTAGNYLDLAFGQYDTYTPMQLAQYVSTVANGGKRIAPHVVAGIYNNSDTGGLGTLKQAITPKVLSTVNITSDQMKVIQTGFHNVANGTNSLNTGTYLHNAAMDLAAKTGTAEVTAADGSAKVNTNVIGYAPYTDPKFSFSIMIPGVDSTHTKEVQTIAMQIVQAYKDTYGG